MAGALRRMVGWKLAGAAAGAAGTLAMDLVWYRRALRREQDPGSFLDWETAKAVASFDDAPAPAQVVRVTAHRLLGTAPDDRYARAATNVMHWTTGVAWAASAGLVAATSARSGIRGAASRMACAFVPPMPKALTPARRGASPSGQALSDAATKNGEFSKSMKGLGVS